ncbi:hypothetical protein [Bacillus piscicola]|uniref:hypothetical protein n=1 Tax=Bacillus piscicola TaxID=1632684 RepID=UPI001F08F24F|nr:hypothetical protein [Bacillus piscicola]
MERALKKLFEFDHVDHMYQEDCHAKYFRGVWKENLSMLKQEKVVNVDIKVENENQLVSVKRIGNEDWNILGYLSDEIA